MVVLLLATACEADKSSEDASKNGDTKGGDGLFALTIDGTEFAPHKGQTFYIAVIEVDTGVVVEKESVKILEDEFSLSWHILEKGKAYRVDCFADMMGDGKCDDPPDHMWRVTIPAVTDEVTLTMMHDDPENPDACNSFK